MLTQEHQGRERKTAVERKTTRGERVEEEWKERKGEVKDGNGRSKDEEEKQRRQWRENRRNGNERKGEGKTGMGEVKMKRRRKGGSGEREKGTEDRGVRIWTSNRSFESINGGR